MARLLFSIHFLVDRRLPMLRRLPPCYQKVHGSIAASNGEQRGILLLFAIDIEHRTADQYNACFVRSSTSVAAVGIFNLPLNSKEDLFIPCSAYNKEQQEQHVASP